jgi:hypothetical protein
VRLASCAVLLSLVCAQRAEAEPFSFRKVLLLGQPPRSTAVSVGIAADGVALQAERTRVILPVGVPQRADVQELTLYGGVKAAVVRVTGGDGKEAAAVVGRDASGKVQIPWAGALDLRGDPGERSAFRIDVKEQPGSPVEVLVSEIVERIHVCGENRSPIRPRILDPKSMTLRAASRDRVQGASAANGEIVASADGPGPAGAPLFRWLELLAVSTRGEAGSGASTTALTDGNTASFWTEGNPGGSSGEFATFRREGGEFPLRALTFVPLPSTVPKDAAISIARSLWLIGEDGTRLKVRLPDAPDPGRRYWAVPSKPIAARCLTVMLDESSPLAGGKGGPTVLAEVEAFTELDFGSGLERLVQDLGAGAATAAQAASLLSGANAGVAAKIGVAWPGMTAEAKRRAVRVLAAHAERDEAARKTLLLALTDGNNDLHKPAFEALLSGPSGRAALLDRVAQPTPEGDATAVALAKRAPRESLAALLSALALESGSDRKALREAIAVACQEGGDEVLAALRAWAQEHANGYSARAALALALARIQRPAEAHELAAEIVAADLGHETRFEDLWRLVQAARTLSPMEAVDGWLASLVEKDERWMLRAGAIEALSERGAGQAPSVALAALAKDRYPRVRVAAAKALVAEPPALEALSEHALKDSWPMVRAASVERLTGAKAAEQVLERAVVDRAHQVRAAAIRALAIAGSRAAWPVVDARLEDPDEFPEVVAEAVQFARTLCVAQASPALLGLMRKGLKPDAPASDVDTSMLAFEALTQLGGTAAQSALALTKGAMVPSAFRTAAQLSLRHPPTCVPAASKP